MLKLKNLAVAPTALVVFLWPVLVADMLPGQQILWERTGVQYQTTLGYFLASGGLMTNLGDLDGDLCEDLLVIGADIVLYQSQLWILSGRDGSTIRTVPR